MAVFETWLDQDLKKPVRIQYLSGNLFSQDNMGNLIGVNVTDDGAPATLGGSVSANVIRADGATVAVDSGVLSGNKASVTLPQAAYAVPGVITVVIKITSGTDITTLAAVVTTVYRSSTDTIVDPGTIIPSIQTLISQIETAVASIPSDYSSLWTTLAPAYSTSATYAVGQYVTYNGGLYRCTTAITSAESWTAAHWTAAKVGNDLSDLKSTLGIQTDMETNGLNSDNGYFNSLYDMVLGSTNKWTLSGTSAHYLLPVTGGNTVTIKANNVNNAIIAFFRSYKKPVVNTYPDFSTETGFTERIVISSGTISDITVPSDSHYLYVAYGDLSASVSNKPLSVKTNGREMTVGVLKQMDNQTDYLNANITRLNAKCTRLIDNEALNTNSENGYSDENLDMVLGSNNKWTGSGISSHIIIPVSSGDSVYIQSNNSNSTIYGIFTEYAIPITNDTPAFSSATGFTERLSILKKTRITFTVPEDGKYLYLTKSYNGEAYTPITVKINGFDMLKGVRGLLDSFNEDVEYNITGAFLDIHGATKFNGYEVTFNYSNDVHQAIVYFSNVNLFDMDEMYEGYYNQSTYALVSNSAYRTAILYLPPGNWLFKIYGVQRNAYLIRAYYDGSTHDIKKPKEYYYFTTNTYGKVMVSFKMEDDGSFPEGYSAAIYPSHGEDIYPNYIQHEGQKYEITFVRSYATGSHWDVLNGIVISGQNVYNENPVIFNISQGYKFTYCSCGSLTIAPIFSEMSSLTKEIEDTDIAVKQNEVGKRKHLNILVLGHSFSSDCWGYVPFILKTYGITVNLYMYYRGNDSIYRMVQEWNDTSDDGYDEWGLPHIRRMFHIDTRYKDHWETDAGGIRGMSPKMVLEIANNPASDVDHWDIITIQTAPTDVFLTGPSQNGGPQKGYEPYVRQAIGLINASYKKPYSLGWFCSYTRILPMPAIDPYPAVSGSEFDNRVDALRAAESIYKNEPFEFVIPAAAAIFSARTNRSLASTSVSDIGNLWYSDAVHIQNGIPRYIGALTVIQSLFKKFYPELSVIGDQTRIDADWISGKQLPTPSIHGDVLSTDEALYELAQKCAVVACEHPFDITPIYLVNDTTPLQFSDTLSRYWADALIDTSNIVNGQLVE